MSLETKALVYWLDPWAWDKEFEIVPLDRQPESVGRWLQHIHEQGWKVMLLPYDARISGGLCDGGHVIAVETGEGRQFAALPPPALAFLRDELPLGDYEALTKVTPQLHDGAPPKREDSRP